MAMEHAENGRGRERDVLHNFDVLPDADPAQRLRPQNGHRGKEQQHIEDLVRLPEAVPATARILDPMAPSMATLPFCVCSRMK